MQRRPGRVIPGSQETLSYGLPITALTTLILLLEVRRRQLVGLID